MMIDDLVFVHYKGEEVIKLSLDSLKVLHGHDGIAEERVTDAWEKNGEWHFQIEAL